MAQESHIKIWDPLVRFFHWSLVTAFLVAYLTEETLLPIHIQAGYLILGLLLVRVVWGFVGTAHARFSDFIYSPVTITGFLRDTFFLKARRYLGHNPAGGAMVMLLIIMLGLTCLSGLLLYGAGDQAGPLAGWSGPSANIFSLSIKTIHETCVDITLLLVCVHVLGVLVESLIHRENLVAAMVSGFKRTLNESSQEVL